ncbi:DUF2829 domain-containing protein [Sediminispirochaeta smaragdinae]|uniref:Thoeris anti-defense 2-like domain-containing protein n=1 Tax=Sediminispirochaeta smaragdinae (strain DSM 11293 / JCM 15392 / SEBR 4228) TaxID=573413 RepID=E1R6W3_SEDSS|nr:DUF2829 domain-containing protein [Sediminispirochaeta smaragdinae]ADK81290.1 conserved hypothetical protein [Sediminispirochaeta smaragdinae DSM 11293]
MELEEKESLQGFIGVKRIKARPMTRRGYNGYRGWQLPADENGDDEGMLVEYVDGGKSNHPAHEGYISWSPIDVFNRAYRPCDALTFGFAIEAAKAGEKIARKGWNGKGMFVFYQKGYPEGIPINKNTAEATRLPEGTVCKFRPYLMMKTAQNDFVPWVASQTDILAEDWEIIEQGEQK